MKALITIAILAIALPVFGLSVEIDSTRENEDDITVFFTLTDDGQNSYEFHGDFAKGSTREIQAQLDAQAEKLALLIFKDLYPGAEPKQREGRSEYDSFKLWIGAGAKNTAIIDEEKVVTVISREKWKSTHPEVSELDTLRARVAALEAK